MDEVRNSGNAICPLCFSIEARDYFYPPTTFNDKIFHYLECKSCGSSYVFPFPDQKDFDVIYGENDHTYLKKLKTEEKYIHSFNYALYNHQSYQVSFFQKGEFWKGRKSLLDIGCGSGFYMEFARRFGLEVTGIEYNEQFTQLLRSKTELDIHSFQEFEKIYEGKKFDIIHLGHILEHLIKPHEMISWLSKYAHDRTIIIIDGPLEKNWSFASFIISLGSRIRRNPMNHYAPQHITFTDKNSQLNFFEKNGLQTIRIKTVEQMFPLPSEPDIRSPKKFMMFLIGRLSIVITKLIPGWGNVFHYVGKFK